MTSQYQSPAAALATHPVYTTLNAFPIVCFSLTLLTDLAFWQTSNLLWLHFSEWLLVAGLVFGVFVLLARAGDYLVRGMRHPWPAVLGGVAVLILAAINSLFHTADGRTAVVPFGLALSVATVLAMIITAWLGRPGVRHV